MAESRLLRTVMLTALVPVLASTAFAAGAPYEPKTELGFLVGATLPDGNLVGDPDDFGPLGPAVGIRGAHLFGDSLNWFGDATTSWHGDNQLAAGDVYVSNVRTGIELFTTRPLHRFRWFVGGSAGWSWVNYKTNALDFDRPFVSAGFGQRWLSDNHGFFRWETRVDRLVQNEGLNGSDVANVQLLFGWALPIGGPPPDEDGDGVPDRNDNCPATPAGAIVDANGCPMDTDGDGILDGLDACPGTPRGAKVDASGCPLDSDGDSVFDGLDKCPNTPRDATVDATGCPSDSDGDSVPDGLDKCPNTPRGVQVDATGCPIDSDGDGVFDGPDRCPDTPRGTPVDANGCPKAPPKAVSPFIPVEKQPVVLEGVTFATDSATLTAGAEEILTRVAAGLKDHPDVRVEVAGHTDSTGSDRHNQVLSQWRAEAVRDFLIGLGVPAARIEATGYGEAEPVADNKTQAGRAKNRRVELRRL